MRTHKAELILHFPVLHFQSTHPNVGDLVQREHPKISLKYGGPAAQKPAISPKMCKIWTRFLWRTNRKSHTRFRLASKSMILDNLERPKRHSCRNKQNLRSPL